MSVEPYGGQNLLSLIKNLPIVWRTMKVRFVIFDTASAFEKC